MRTQLDSESIALVDAIMFGDKSHIESDTKTMVYRAGIGHIMAVSGVHLSIVCVIWKEGGPPKSLPQGPSAGS